MAADGTFRTKPHVLGLVTLIGRLTQERLNASLGDLDLTFAQAVALVRLWRTGSGTLPQSDLIESLAVSRASGSQVLAELERRGLVERNPHPADARRQIVHLTNAGRELEHQVFELFDRAEEELLDGIDAEHRLLAGELLRTMLGNARTPEVG